VADAVRPAGVDSPPSREFAIGVPAPKKHTLNDSFRDWWFHLWNFSFNRGGSIEIDIDDKMIEDLKTMGWIHNVKGEWFMTRKGSRELNTFLREEMNRLDV